MNFTKAASFFGKLKIEQVSNDKTVKMEEFDINSSQLVTIQPNKSYDITKPFPFRLRPGESILLTGDLWGKGTELYDHMLGSSIKISYNDISDIPINKYLDFFSNTQKVRIKFSSIKSSNYKVFDIIGFSDYHGTLELDKPDKLKGKYPVAEVMAKNIKTIISQNPDRSLVISSGDMYQGSILSDFNGGRPVMKFLNSIRTEAYEIGNHEFDWGLENTLTDNTARYNYICSNLYVGSDWPMQRLPAYIIYEKDGIKIAVVGAITESINSTVSNKNLDKERYYTTDIVENVNRSVKDARLRGANIVIAAIHEGEDKLYDIVKKLVGVDAVFGGHSHINFKEMVKPDGADKEIPVVVSRSNGEEFYDIQITLSESGKIAYKMIPIEQNTESKIFPFGYKAFEADNSSPCMDKEAFGIISTAKQNEKYKEYKKSVGNTSGDLNVVDINSKDFSCAAGNWATEVIRKHYENDPNFKCDFVILNSGGFRKSIPQGEIYKSNIYELLPYNNNLCMLKVKGSVIKNILIRSVKKAEVRRGLQIAGLKFEYTKTKDSVEVAKLVKCVKSPVIVPPVVTEVPINDEEFYNVITNDYLSEGKDEYKEFMGIQPVMSKETSIYEDLNKMLEVLPPNYKNINPLDSWIKDDRIINSETALQ